MTAVCTTPPAGVPWAAEGGCPSTLPAGWLAAPLCGSHHALRVCVVVHTQPPTAPGLHVLRELDDARVYLGCIVDRGGCVHGWTEIWVQSLDWLHESVGLTARIGAGAPAAEAPEGGPLTNHLLDQLWMRRAQAMSEIDPGGVIHSTWERENPPPMFIDRQSAEVAHPRYGATDVSESASRHWRLCRDDALLERAGLPPYRTTLHRYLHVPELSEESPFVAVTPNAPRTERVIDDEHWPAPSSHAADSPPPAPPLLPLNPSGGLMLIRRHDPLDVGTFVDLLSAGAPAQTDAPPLLDPVQLTSVDEHDPLTCGWLFFGRAGRAGRMVETLHLKLRIIADAVNAVRELTRRMQAPMLNLRAESFCLRLGQRGCGLPVLWTARVILAKPGAAVELPLGETGETHHVRLRPATHSIYEPPDTDRAISGVGLLRLRQVLDDKAGGTLIEGTFQAHERINAVESDLLWLRCSLRGQRIHVHAHLERDSALAGGEWRLRTGPQRFTAEALDALRAYEGREIQPVEFHLMPRLSSPCDLYALGVLAVRVLLVNEDTTLPKALDEIHSLGREIASDANGIGEVFRRDPKWLHALGPQRLVQERLDPQVASAAIPAVLWWDVLAMIVRMFPGLAVGPDEAAAACDFGDAPPGGLHHVFEPTMQDLAQLILRTRSMIAVDWTANREIHDVVREHLAALGK